MMTLHMTITLITAVSALLLLLEKHEQVWHCYSFLINKDFYESFHSIMLKHW